MKTFDAAMIAEIAKTEARFCWLIDFTVGGFTYRWTDLDIELYVDGDKYVPEAFAVGEITATPGLGVASVQLQLSNTDHSMRWLVLDREIRNTAVSVGFAAVDGTGGVLSTATLFYGLVSTYVVDDTAVVLTLVNELALWHKKTLRQASMSCRWTFKGPECGYAGGETWCDKSHERCAALANTAAFGGFRFLEDIMERKVRWGRKA